MEENETVADYLDRLEEELFDKYKIPEPTNEELEEYLKEEELEGEQPYSLIKDGYANPYELEDELEDDDEGLVYREIECLPPDEGKIFKVDKIPFSDIDEYEKLMENSEQ